MGTLNSEASRTEDLLAQMTATQAAHATPSNTLAEQVLRLVAEELLQALLMPAR